MGKHKSDDYKLTAVKYYLDTKEPSLRDTCDIFKCSKDSLLRWVKRYLETGSVENKPRPEGSYKVKQKHVDYIMSLIDKKPTMTLDDILAHFYKKFKDITLSRTHLDHIIKFANLTYKKIQHTHKPDKRYNKPIDYDDEYNRFYNKIQKYKMKNIISIDETSISVGMSIRKGRTKIGKRVQKVTKDNIVFVKYTLIMAISTEGIEGWTLYKKGGIDHSRLIEFLEMVLNKRKNKLVLMDNVSSHRNPDVKKFIKDSINDYVHVLPYHHSQNPIEAFFNQLKHYMRKDEPMSYDEVKVSLRKAIKKISKENLKNYFTSSLSKSKQYIEESKTKYHKKPKIYKK
jgi:transposase